MTGATVFIGAFVALAVGVLLQPLVLRLMTTIGALDVPSARSGHTTAKPRGGGVAVVAAAAIGLSLHPSGRVIALALLLFAAIGLADDLRGVSVRARLGLQLAAGLGAGVLLVPAAHAKWAPLLVLLSAIWLAACVNAFNFMDGINGISSAHAALVGAFYALVGWVYGMPTLTAAGATVAAAALTFLPWNAGRARIFLGDVGSYGLGGVLGALAAYGLLRGAPPGVLLAPLALYLADTGVTLARRCWQGEAWHLPHRTHIYQRLTDRGWSHQRVTLTTALVSAAVCASALAMPLSPPPVRAGLALAIALALGAYLALPALLRSRPPARRGAYA